MGLVVLLGCAAVSYSVCRETFQSLYFLRKDRASEVDLSDCFTNIPAPPRGYCPRGCRRSCCGWRFSLYVKAFKCSTQSVSIKCFCLTNDLLMTPLKGDVKSVGRWNHFVPDINISTTFFVLIAVIFSCRSWANNDFGEAPELLQHEVDIFLLFEKCLDSCWMDRHEILCI